MDLTALTRGSDSAVVLGCGPSIRQIDADTEDMLDRVDTWSLNNFIIHPSIVPTFYHLEVKKHRNGALMRRLTKERREMYRDVCWILDKNRDYLLKYVRPEWYPRIYTYKKTYKAVDSGLYTPGGKPRVSCKCSLSIVLDIMARQGYTKIFLIGVDLFSSAYFWTDNPLYADADIPELMRSCKPDERPVGAPHPTISMTTFIKGLGEHNNIEMINLSPQSMLADVIRTEDVRELHRVL